MAKNAKRGWAPGVGCWLNSPNHWACEMAAAIGYGAIVLDLEHGTIHAENADRLAALARALGLTVLMRAAPERIPVQQALDAGADGLILPQVADLAHAKSGSRYAKYPPLGVRGMGFPRSLGWGDTPADFVERENERIAVYVMIETPGALRDVRRIAALDTVDGLFMGPYDLSLTRGRGQYAATRADERDARAIAAAAAKAGKRLGMPVGDDASWALARELGADLITIADDFTALQEGLAARFARFAKRA
jgi:2-dehydro-3-deoxyglucarate aldolase/4-hydroxy-2-oxoheptanedioate aldolase